jgi:hypothetical protein
LSIFLGARFAERVRNKALDGALSEITAAVGVILNLAIWFALATVFRSHHDARGRPVPVLDMYEHAYHMDCGAAAARYVDAFMQGDRLGQRGEALTAGRPDRPLGSRCAQRDLARRACARSLLPPRG